ADQRTQQPLAARPDVMNELKEPQVQRQTFLGNSPVGAEPRTQQRPEPFERIDMDLAEGPIPKCGHVALVLGCCYVDMCVIFSSSGSLRMRLISQFSRASGARFSETDDSPETVVERWILPAKLKALLGSSTLLSQVVPGKDLMDESKSPLFGIAPAQPFLTLTHLLARVRDRESRPIASGPSTFVSAPFAAAFLRPFVAWGTSCSLPGCL